MKVIRKQRTLSAHDIISTKPIASYKTDTSIILDEPVKQYIDLKFDSEGHIETTKYIVGRQYDHHVTWLRFNLKDLIWNWHPELDSDEVLYNNYTFKLFFNDIRHPEKTQSHIWEFDGMNFEIPYTLTQYATTYRMTLLIEEWQGDKNTGNIANDTRSHIERFISQDVYLTVEPSIFDPTKDLTFSFTTDTKQLASLTKPHIEGTLTDNGELIFNTQLLGQQFDNYVKYISFNPTNITAHLQEFNIAVIFTQDTYYEASLFQRTGGEYDDNSAPLIAWIPTNVLEHAGKWNVAIIAFVGNLDHLNHPSVEHRDYYFYVSNDIKMKVDSSVIDIQDFDTDVDISITSNLATACNNNIIGTSNNEIFQARPEEE